MKNTKISWATGTTNFWWGCVKVSAGCENCYAETFSKRTGRNIWGPAKTTERWRTAAPWKDIVKWDAEAGAKGERIRVFVQSMSDFFEDHPQVEEWRREAVLILERLKSTDILLLTKRPENVEGMVPSRWLHDYWPPHIWMGTSVENQKLADKRIPTLLRIPAYIHFLSCEPLLGAIDLHYVGTEDWDVLNGWKAQAKNTVGWANTSRIDWVIAGGESGPGARPMNANWGRQLRDQCVESDVAFHFKQWGEHIPGSQLSGKQIADLPDSIYHNALPVGDDQAYKVGKDKAGHLLDGVEWLEFPIPHYAKASQYVEEGE